MPQRGPELSSQPKDHLTLLDLDVVVSPHGVDPLLAGGHHLGHLLLHGQPVGFILLALDLESVKRIARNSRSYVPVLQQKNNLSKIPFYPLQKRITLLTGSVAVRTSNQKNTKLKRTPQPTQGLLSETLWEGPKHETELKLKEPNFKSQFVNDQANNDFIFDVRFKQNFVSARKC